MALRHLEILKVGEFHYPRKFAKWVKFDHRLPPPALCFSSCEFPAEAVADVLLRAGPTGNGCGEIGAVGPQNTVVNNNCSLSVRKGPLKSPVVPSDLCSVLHRVQHQAGAD